MKRIFINGCLVLWFFLTLLVNWACLMLDNLFFPGYKKVKIKPPLVIIGMPRSATTLCFNLLAADNDRFTAMKLWEILFAPSVLQKKLINCIIILDNKTNRFIRKGIVRFDRYLFRKMESIHPMSLFYLEEDNFIFLHTFRAAALAILFPGWKRFILMQRIDDDMAGHWKKSHMSFYKGCIQRHLYVYGTERRYLSKSPPHSPMIKTLQSTFPGCQFIHMLRDPFYTIPSAICVFIQIRELFNTPSDIRKITSLTLAMADLFYYYPLVVCGDLKGETLCVLTFNEITQNACLALRKVYNQLGIVFTDEFEQFLLNSTTMVKAHKTKKKYTPEDFGLTIEAIRERYGYVYGEFPDLQG